MLIASCYTVEVVTDDYSSDDGLHLLFEIPLYTKQGVHDVFRTAPSRQPIAQFERATQYQLLKTSLLIKRNSPKLLSKSLPPMAVAHTDCVFVNKRSPQLSLTKRLVQLSSLLNFSLQS